MKSAFFSNGFIDVKVEIDDDEVAFHVMNYLVPKEGGTDNSIRYMIKAFVGKSHYEDRKEKIDDLMGEYGESIVSYVIRDKKCYYNEDNKTTFFWEDASILMIYNEDKKGLFIDTYRAIRQIMISDLLNRGGVIIHSSSVFIGKKGYLFVGSKRAGKTSSLFQYLNDSRPDVSYGSNERTILVPDNGRMFMYGWPGTAFVGVGTIKSTIGLDALYDVHKKAGETATWLSQHHLTNNQYIDELIAMEESAYNVQEKIWLTSNEIAFLTGKKITNHGYLDKVIWPCLMPGAPQSIEKVQRRMDDEVITELNFFSDWLGIRKKTDAKNRVILDTVLEFPQYEIRGGKLVAKIDEL